MYQTKPMTKDEIELIKKVSPFAGAMGHPVIGYREDGNIILESSSEIRAITEKEVTFVRRRQPNGEYIYRRIVSR